MKASTRPTPSLPWHKTRISALAMAALAAAVIYPLALRAEDTGSLQQYSLLLLLVIFIGVMLRRALRRSTTVHHVQK